MLDAVSRTDAPTTFVQKLTGRLTAIGPGLADLELSADAATPLGKHTHVRAQLSFLTERSFRARGRIAIAGHDALAFTTANDGHLAEPADGGVRHGTAVLDVTGIGALAGAHGQVSAAFVVSADGHVTDDQILVLFQPHRHNRVVSP